MYKRLEVKQCFYDNDTRLKPLKVWYDIINFEIYYLLLKFMFYFYLSLFYILSFVDILVLSLALYVT